MTEDPAEAKLLIISRGRLASGAAHLSHRSIGARTRIAIGRAGARFGREMT
jgi:hypothetical protein